MSDTIVNNIKGLGFTWQTADPFLFCVHHLDKYPGGNELLGPDASLQGRQLGQDFTLKDGWRMYHGEKVPGFPAHPHRGFETVTVVLKGMVDHSDSHGASGRYGNGDVQWMTAGSGLQHAEMFPLLNQTQENPLELFQIWLNLPKAKKYCEPHYTMLWSEDIPVRQEKDNNGLSTEIRVIAGEVYGTKALPPAPDSWAADEKNETGIWLIHMEAGAKWTVPTASEGINRTLYFYRGKSISLNKRSIDNGHSAELKATDAVQITNGDADAYLLLLQGKPINEPIAQHGPFVMNSNDEIQQAFADYEKTRFGGWPWPNPDQVHGRENGRFAKYADGREERK
ncbi:MAG: pirin family protein [Fibrobacteria bacterium]|nr:pirin family protein [Fibrobacteria bacterium]